MTCSQRQFKILDLKIKFNYDNILQVISLMENHGKFLEVVKIEDIAFESTIKARSFVGLLNQFPKLTILEIKAWNLRIDCWGNEVLKVPKLEDISIQVDREADLGRFLLTFYPQTIKKFSTSYSGESVADFVRYQKSIKELKVSRNFENLNIYKDLNLEKATFDVSETFSSSINKSILEFIRHHKNLKEFYIQNDFENLQDVFEGICGLENLEKVSFSICEEKNYTHIHKLSRLKHLKHIQVNLELMESLYVIEISRLKMECLESVEIYDATIDEVSLINISNNWTGLKHLKILKPFLSLNKILNNLNKLESLTILMNYNYEDDFYQETEKFSYNYDGYKYLNLKKLSVPSSLKFSCDLLESLPNLEYLKIDYELSCTKYSISILRMLSNLKNLKNLFFYFKIKASTIQITDEVKIIKKLYSKLDNFELIFKNISYSNFIRDLQAVVENDTNMITYINAGLLIIKKEKKH